MKLLDTIILIIGILVLIVIVAFIIWPEKTTVQPLPEQKIIPIEPKPIQTPPINIPSIQTPAPIPNNPIGGDGTIPIITVDTKTAQAGIVQINETLTQDGQPITDAECETDIINQQTKDKVVDFKSFYNNGDGTMTYTWDNATPGIYTISQYCWHGITLDLNRIYNNSTLTIT